MAIHAMTMAGASVAATAASSSSPVAAMGMISPSTIPSSELSSSLENPSYPPLTPAHRWCNVRHAIVADEVDASFQVIAIQHGEEETAAVFSSRTREWAMIGWGTVRYRFN
jgi:hypothetical protein